MLCRNPRNRKPCECFSVFFFFYLKTLFSQRVKNFAHCEFCFCGDWLWDNEWPPVHSVVTPSQEQPCWGVTPPPLPRSLLPAGGLEKLPGRPGFIAERFTLFIWKKCRMPSPRSLCLHKLHVFIIHRNTAHSLFLCHLSLITYASDVRIQSRFLSILGFKT